MHWHFFYALLNLLILPIYADDMAQSEIDVICMEDRMRSLGMISSESDYASNIELCCKLLKGIDLEATIPVKKVSLWVNGTVFCYYFWFQMFFYLFTFYIVIALY